MTDFTPGPWNGKGTHKWSTDFGVFDLKGRGICSTGGYADGKEGTYEENKSNARLIATAPELYEALNRLQKEVSGCLGAFEHELRPIISNTNFLCITEKLEKARAILAKARGSS